jgi:hypothetical protein
MNKAKAIDLLEGIVYGDHDLAAKDRVREALDALDPILYPSRERCGYIDRIAVAWPNLPADQTEREDREVILRALAEAQEKRRAARPQSDR